MPLDLLAAFVVFALAGSLSPGPNNIMLMTSGVNFGVSRTLPHIAGIATGFFVMLLLVGFGVGQMLQANPSLYTGLRIAGTAYMLWFAWKIATGGRPRAGSRAGAGGPRPLRFVEAAMFQWVNPKAWAMAVTAAAAYTVPNAYAASLLLISVTFILVGAPCMGIWTAFGVALRSWLEVPWRLRAFNVGMAILLVLSFLPVALGIIRT